jgi:hypothetical protein
MAEVEILKQRIVRATTHLEAKRSAREREAETLIETWSKIQERFARQDEEITRFRARVAGLEETNEELRNLVESLLSTVETGVNEPADETMPQIAAAAQGLLRAEPVSFAPAHVAESPAPDAGATESRLDTLIRATTLQSAAEDTALPAEQAEPEPAQSELDDEIDEIEAFDELEDEIDDESEPVAAALTADTIAAEPEAEAEDEPDSPPASVTRAASGASRGTGIRSLLSRIELAVNKSKDEPPAAAEAEEDDDLARELREIEDLRSELNGLRQKMAAGGSA